MKGRENIIAKMTKQPITAKNPTNPLKTLKGTKQRIRTINPGVKNLINLNPMTMSPEMGLMVRKGRTKIRKTR